MSTYPSEALIESFRNNIRRSRVWIVALGWLALAYGILSILRVAVSAFAAFGYLGAASLNYPLMISAGSGFLALIVCLVLIPLGIVLIRAGEDIRTFLATEDFSAVIAYHGKVRTSAILAVTVLIIDILSNVVTALLYFAVAAMPSLVGFGD